MKLSVSTKVITTVEDLRRWRSRLSPLQDLPLVGFVPTMGALHQGHLELIRQARSRCRHVVVSIFVNPLQFGPAEDYSRYPRPLEKDIELCRGLDVDLVFNPTAEVMYPRGQDEICRVQPPESLTHHLCGAFRPGHFVGVATVVLKLFALVEPSVAFFGEKDYQQLCVIRRMVEDLNLPMEIVGVPTVRESDGLALSSRNVYLSEDERKLAPRLYRTLELVREKIRSGAMPIDRALAEGRAEIAALPGTTLQYLEACHPRTLQPVTSAADGFVVLVAAKIGAVRLIDNVIECS